MRVSRCGVFFRRVVLTAWIALSAAPLLAQADDPMPQWEKAAGGKMSFEVASVKLNKGETSMAFSPHNFPWGSTDNYGPTGGRFSARYHSLEDIIAFAYKLTGQQIKFMLHPVVPAWTIDTRFDIEARAAQGSEPTKDQMRLMVQSLLADRFHLQLRFVTREGTVYALRLIQPGVTGPNIKKHPEDGSCTGSRYNTKTPGQMPLDGLPPLCTTVERPRMRDKPEVIHYTARGTSMAEFAKVAALWHDDGRPVFDETGLQGAYDFSLTYSQPIDVPQPPMGATDPAVLPPMGGRALPAFANDHGSYGTELMRALKDQLGMKLDTIKGPVQSIVIDHVEMPTNN